MNIIENIKLALEGLRLNKLRTFLTMLGIIIGISSVIGIFTVGKSIEESVVEMFDQLGSNQIYLYVREAEFEVDGSYYGAEYPQISLEDLRAFMDIYGDKVSGYDVDNYNTSGLIDDGKEGIDSEIKAVLEGHDDIYGLEMLAGRFLNLEDMDAFRNTVVITDKLVEEMFDGDSNSALGKELIVDGYNSVESYIIVGVVKQEEMDFGALGGMAGDYEEPKTLYIPWTTYSAKRGNIDLILSSFYTAPVKGYDSISLAEEIKEGAPSLLLNNNEEYYLDYYTMEESVKSFNEQLGIVQLGIGGIAAISLLVGGIGVMNILLVSVTERTREIGIRKALGATKNDIRIQFLIEAVIVCVIGGIIGIIIGGGLGYALSNVMGYATLPALKHIIIAVAFSMAIGIFFGYYPANKAAKLNPIDALRFE